MTQIVMVGPSTVPPPPPGQDPASEPPKTWEAHNLRPLVEEIFRTDPRFVGLSKFIVNVRIFWSFEISTACAGHGFIFFNPNWWDELPDETCRTVMAHEVWHLILKHLERGEGADPTIHNEACDHVINLGLDKDGFTFEGWNCLKDPIYIGMSSEQVYNLIWEDRENKPPKPQPGTPSKDQIEQLIKDQLLVDAANGAPRKTLEQQKEEASKNVDDAQVSIGTQPGHENIKLDLTKNRVFIQRATYQQIFEEYLVDPLSGGKRTFMRPSRRSHGQKAQLIMPGKFPKRGKKNRLTHLVYALDVSGSITHPQKQQFHESVRTIKEILNPAALTVLLFDTRIVFEKTFTDKEKYGNIQVNAGGGTSLTQVYARMKVLGAEAMVCFTDLQVGIPPKPEWESIWIVPHMHCAIPPGLYGEVYLIPKI